MARNTRTARYLSPGELKRLTVYARPFKKAPYNLCVARGWESKSVELQQDDARSSGEPKHRLTPEQKEIESRKEGLRLSRSRILEQLHSAENPRYREILEKALAVLDEQITRLG
jgi:hypothetical protein